MTLVGKVDIDRPLYKGTNSFWGTVVVASSVTGRSEYNWPMISCHKHVVDRTLCDLQKSVLGTGKTWIRRARREAFSQTNFPLEPKTSACLLQSLPRVPTWTSRARGRSWRDDASGSRSFFGSWLALVRWPFRCSHVLRVHKWCF